MSATGGASVAGAARKPGAGVPAQRRRKVHGKKRSYHFLIRTSNRELRLLMRLQTLTVQNYFSVYHVCFLICTHPPEREPVASTRCDVCSRVIFIETTKDFKELILGKISEISCSDKMDPCSVGVQLQAANECHKTYYTRHTGFKTKEDISSFDLLLLQLRTGMTLSENDTICFHHAKIYIERFEDLQKSCCDPFNMHRKLSKKNLRAIDLHDATFLTAKFGRQFVPGWKLCPKCMQVINGSVDVEAEERQRRKLDSDGRTAKALKSLQFANPGRQTEFTPETSKREKRRLQTKNPSFNSDRQVIPAKSKVYDSQGLLLYSGMDLCDCLDEDCLGCFYACPKCGSNKCGTECRCDRKWLYEQIEIEGGEIIRNKHVGKGLHAAEMNSTVCSQTKNIQTATKNS